MSQTRSSAPQEQHNAPTENDSQSLLASSIRGGTFLISLQVGSRALTFLVNQILLRHLSPELLGMSAQLELYSTTVLFLARESLRVALLRQSGGSHHGNEDEKKEREDSRLQDVVNISYIAVALGPILAYGFGMLYLDRATDSVLQIPYFRFSLLLYAISTFLELLSEPCFVVAQQQMLYGIRASAEASATFAKCIMNCSTAIWAGRSDLDIGVSPFAVGQLTYALVLLVVYHGGIRPQTRQLGFSLVPRFSKKNRSQYLCSLFYYPILSLAANFYGQSVLKHLLTQGDAYVSALFTTTTSQGAFALASNYGSLLARMVFQPIEESSRSVFSRLLGSPESSTLASTQGGDLPRKALKQENTAPKPQVDLARTYFVTVLRLYCLLSIFIVCIGPTLAPILLGLVAGRQWAATSAASVLSLYCYYIPLLAFNGILEAFVASVASSTTLQAQSEWMLGISVGFAVSSYVLLRVFNLGAHGLVEANCLNMLMRVFWSGKFVRGFFKEQGVPLGTTAAPRLSVIVISVVTAWGMKLFGSILDGPFWSLLQVGSIAATYGITMIFLERHFLLGCVHLLRPGRETPQEEHKKNL